ncbi:MAG: hypothetical protein IKB38_09125 [Clostridia bacterium]|nr:hypothetical protein [Clostridia bacterium]
MHNHKKTSIFAYIRGIIDSVLTVAFWTILIFAFDDAYTAVATLTAALAHEAGHKLAFFFFDSKASLPLPRLSGFRIKSRERLSYGKDIICAAAGPFTNIFICFLGLPILFKSPEAYCVFAVVNVATAATNLLPIKGYDGYKLLRSLALLFGDGRFFINIIEIFSFLSICLLTFISLYFIKSFGEGYWIFGVFFFSMISEIGRRLKHKRRE